jgi:hypothetical protein
MSFDKSKNKQEISRLPPQAVFAVNVAGKKVPDR